MTPPSSHPTNPTNPTNPLDPDTISQITSLVANLLIKEPHVAATPPSSPHPDPSYVFSPAWYAKLPPENLPTSHHTPSQPAFFRVQNPVHHLEFAAASRDTKAEADTLMQVLTLLRDNLNRQHEAIENASKEQLVENWRHTRGIFEMLQTRYDILSGIQNNQMEQVRLLQMLSAPPLGPSHLAKFVNHAIRQAADLTQIPATPLSSTYDFVFLVRSFHTLQGACESNWIQLCNRQWRLAIYPTTPRQPVLYAYLECRPVDVVDVWSTHVHFSIKLINVSSEIYALALGMSDSTLHPMPSAAEIPDAGLVEDLEHSFTEEASDWGCAICPAHKLRVGQFADHDMNLVFIISLQIHH